MTQVLIDHAKLEQLVGALEAVLDDHEDLASCEVRHELRTALAQQGEPVAYITETEQGPMVWTPEMYDEACTYCDDGEFPVPLYTAAPAPQAQEPARNVTKEEDAILRGALLRSGTVIHPKPAPQPAQGVPETDFGNMPASFAKWLQREMPAGTVIGDPAWWAPRIYKAARNYMQSAQPKQEPLRELTDEEILSLEKQTPAMNDAGEEWIYFARAVLKKARE